MDIDRELLPYFNIEGNNLVFSAIRDNLPIQNVKLNFFDSNDQLLKIDPKLTGLGHVFPNKRVQLPLNLSAFKRIDLEATLANQTVIYFTYGNGLQGSHFEKRSSDSEFKPYVLEKDKVAQEKARQRISHIE